ncbi:MULTISPECIES: hypothetical protein [Oerskovia]|uniref:Mycothiol-dependent maleylpyruvate isomerase metal-binding domain-containing protein n=1 Tax=Oerskovia enterophila TaxID=43678 RepID=A0A161XG44_9CELL|nr:MULTISPECIES: hypothetical protein [Oerskovia]KRD40658.1 hypothetical protein ASE27_19175 [Oerskovia sp. Root918]KZM35777.1 hypothetical protein OJAG_14750 [Oerskovia enterophila]OCI29255.1 hypothetical protein OERS_40660 [Oerskovia enterophila]
MSAQPEDADLSPVRLVPGPVTPDDVRTAARWLADGVAHHPDAAFDAQAGPVRWSCWATAEHVVDDLLAYALQVAGLPLLDYLPLAGPKGEDEIAHVKREAGPAGMAEVLRAGGELLAAQVGARPDSARAYHPYGLSDPQGFAAMGIVEILVHGRDILEGLTGVAPSLPEGLSARVLTRLFPDLPDATRGLPAAEVLVWATGRRELPGLARRTRWRWDATVR